MDLKILWTDFAKSELNRIYIFYFDHAGSRIAKNETKKIAKATLRLKKKPEIGQIEEFLKGRSHEFRYLVHQSSKSSTGLIKSQIRSRLLTYFTLNKTPKKCNGRNKPADNDGYSK